MVGRNYSETSTAANSLISWAINCGSGVLESPDLDSTLSLAQYSSFGEYLGAIRDHIDGVIDKLQKNNAALKKDSRSMEEAVVLAQKKCVRLEAELAVSRERDASCSVRLIFEIRCRI